MSKINVAINGFGRIGRAFLRLAQNSEEVNVVAVNDLADINNLAYLLKYDTAYGHAPFSVSVSEKEDALVIDGKEIPYSSEKKPEELPWGQYGVDVALEATGAFTKYELTRKHLEAGAKRVVVSAPVKDEPPEDIKGSTVLMGVNDDVLESCDINSNASCTTNAASPLIAILQEKLGIEKALLNTVHGYTSSQDIVDSPNDKWRRGRAGAANIVPSSTGSAVATTKVINSLEDLFDGIAVRVPIPVGSVVDITFIASQETSEEDVNKILKDAAGEERWQGIFTATDESIVSSDIVGDTHASIADLSFTRVVGGNLVKVLGWYDNEMGYTNTLLMNVVKTGRYVR